MGKLLVKGNTTAYFDINGLWVALNEEKGIPRNEIRESYTHIAFSVTEEELQRIEQRFKVFGIKTIKSRPRHHRDGVSLYFEDPDGHKFEFHTGNLNQRLSYYKDEKPHMEFF